MASAANVYGGDEINAIVLTPGSHTTRIGYAGDDFPKIITESHYATDNSGTRIFGESINVPRLNYDIKPILADSTIIDWDAALDQYTHFFDMMKIDQQDQPILITEPIWTDSTYRKTLIENFYENFQFPALYLAKTPTCVSFQQGRPNCLVVDLGHDTTSVTPVVDGISLIKHSVRTHYGGKFLNDQIKDLLNKSPFDAKYRIKSKEATLFPDTANFTLRDLPDNITQSFDDFQKQKTYHEFKELILELPDKPLNSQEAIDHYSQDSFKRLFELPNGQSIKLGLERFQLADTIFNPNLAKFEDSDIIANYPPENGELSLENKYEEYKPVKRFRKNDSAQSTPAPEIEGEKDTAVPTDDTTAPVATPNAPVAPSPSNIRGLAQLITQTLSTVNIDLRAAVAHNIIVTGGVSLIPQLTERLYNELSNSNPGLKIRLHAVGNTNERMNQAWIGGSVLSSLGTFHQMWVTKQEYEEAGSDRLLNQRFR